MASGGIPDFLEWKQFLEDKIVNDGSPGGGGGVVPDWVVYWHPSPTGAGGGMGLLEAPSRPAHAAWDCE